MNIVAAIGLVGVAIVGWLTQLLGLPGNWIVVVAAMLYAWWLPGDGRLAVGWNTVLVLAVLAAGGEAVEFIAGALGVSKAGGSRRGALLALVGSLVGGVVGLFIGVPVPVVGSLAAALFLADSARWWERSSAKAGKAATLTPACRSVRPPSSAVCLARWES